MVRSLLLVRGVETIPVASWRSIVQCAESLGIHPDWLACVISFETGGSFSPAQPNMWALREAQRKRVPYVGAMGLLQFMPDTAERLGTSTDQLRGMTFDEQMVFVYKYLAPFARRMTSLEDTYLAVFYPAAMGRPDDFVVGNLYGTSFQKAVYIQNRGLDRDNDGIIKRGEIVATIQAIYNDADGQRIAWTEDDEDTRVASFFDLVKLARDEDDKNRA
jgi:hypothetical protein